MTFKPPSFMVSDENIDKDLDQPTDSVEQLQKKKQHMIINKIFKNQKQL